MANRYTRALKQIKDATLDEKLKLLEDLPTNNTTGLYTDVPGYPAPEITVPGDIDSPLDLEEDGDGSPGYTGNDTTGLFETDGTIRAVEPPGDTSYVLGPMMSMWYAWGNFTQIGYVRQSDRRMVNLARITGELSAWDGSSNFTSYGQLTVEQAVWFKNQTRQDYRAFYPGPPSNPADQYGRYIGSIVAESKPTERVVPENPYLRYVDGTGRAADPSDTFSLMMDRNAELGNLVYQDPKALQDYINSLTPEEADSQLFDNSISMFGDTIAAAASAEYNIGRQTAKALTNVAGGTAFNPSLRAVGSQGRGLGGEVRIGQHGTGQQAAQGIKKSGFRPGSRQNVYGTQSVFLDPSKSGKAADEFARAGASAEAGGRGTAGRSAGQRAADLRAAGTEAGEKIPVAYKPGTGSRMNVPGTKYAEVGVDASKATRGARLAQNAATMYPKSAKAAQLVRTGATTAKVTGARAVAKTLGKAVPFAGAAISVADAGVRFSQGDIAGGLMSGLTAVPGPVGWTALGAQVVYDTARANPTSSIRGRSGAKRAIAKEEKEYGSYQDYVDRAKETLDKKNIKLDKGLLDVLKTELGLSDKLSDEDKEYLVDLFDNSEDVDPEEATAFVKKIVKKLGSDIKENVHSVIRRNLLEQATGGGTITAHTDAGDVTITIPPKPPVPPQNDSGSGMQTTPQEGLPTDFSKSTLNYLRGQNSDYFVSGYVQSIAERDGGPAELEKMFTGTTVSWYQVVRMTDEINELEKARTEAQERMFATWDEVYPQITALLNKLDAIPKINRDGELYVTRENWNLAQSYFNEIDRLFARHDEAEAVVARIAEQWLNVNGRLGAYVKSGKLVDVDPFKLNDPTIKKEKELDEEEINKLIAELRKAASDAQRAALLNKLKAFGYGALLAAGAVIGFKILLGGAGLKALGAPLVNLLRKLAPKVTKTPVPKDAGSLPQHLKAAADKAIEKLAGKAPNDPAARGLLDRISRAESSGNASAVEKALKAFERFMGGTPNSPGGMFNSYQPSGKLLTESQKRALRNVKKPVQVKEIPTKVKVKPTSRKNKTVGADMMKTPKVPQAFKPEPQIWNSSDKKKNLVASQEKKNQVLELVGAAEHHWSHLTEESRKKKQEKVNEMLSVEYDKQMEDMYEKYVSKQNKLDKTVSALKQKKKYLSDSDTSVAKKKTFTKWYDSVDSTTADKIISDAKIETKDQIMELVVAEFNRLRLQEGMSSKGFEYIYGLAVNNIVSQYRIDSKFASDLLHSSADATDYEFGPGYPGSHINSIGDYQVDSSRLVNVNAYYDSTFGSASGSGSRFTLNTVDGAGAASRSSLESALGITLPSGIPNAPLTGTPTEGSAVQRTFTGAKPGNIINFTWGFTSSEKGLPADLKVDDYAFVAISGRTTKFVSILSNGDVKGGAFKYRLNPSDIDGNGNVRVSIGIVDVHDKLYNTTLRITSFGSLYAGDLGTVGDTTDAADLGMPVKPPKKGDEIALDTIPYEPPSPGPGGYKPPGSYDPNKFYNLDNKTPMPSPNLPQTGPGQSSIPDGTEVAASYPTTNTPLDKVGGFKGIPKGKGIYPMDKDGNLYNPQTGLPIKKAGKKQPKTMVAHHEPQGEVLSEKKRLKSVKDFSNYPGKPSPMGWPEEEPPKTINGYHPDLVNGKEVSNRYNRLDAISAKAMPATGNPYIDKKVRAAAARIKEEAKITNKMSTFKKPTDVAPEYPKTAPPEMDPETGMHPKYGKKYKHDKLDPHSAEFMPPTGDPVIDANIKKATNTKEKSRKLKILLGRTKKG